jgi:hypothetical protein
VADNKKIVRILFEYEDGTARQAVGADADTYINWVNGFMVTAQLRAGGADPTGEKMHALLKPCKPPVVEEL